jgi:hypothetical protein
MGSAEKAVARKVRIVSKTYGRREKTLEPTLCNSSKG